MITFSKFCNLQHTMIAFHQRVLNFLSKKFYTFKAENRFTKGPKLSHVTIYACGNAGDSILSACVRKTFCQLGNYNKWNIINLRQKVKDYTIEKINKTKACIVGGGGLFLPDSNKNSISGWQWAISQEQLYEIKSPIIIFTVGYNYFRGQIPNDLFIKNLHAILEKASFVGLRNNGSIRAINELTNNKFKDKIVFQPCTTTLIKKLYADKIPAKAETKNIAVNMAFDRVQMRFGDKKEVICKQVAKAVKQIEKRGYHINYIIHCSGDTSFLEYLNKEHVNYNIVNLLNKLDIDTIFEYNKFDLVMGMRGHAQMIPFGLNTEIMTLGSHEKMKYFLEDIDATDWYIELTEDPRNLCQRIFEKFIQIHEIDSQKTKNRLIEQQEKLYQITLNNFEIINKILNNHNENEV